jgi:hypothetical protein
MTAAFVIPRWMCGALIVVTLARHSQGLPSALQGVLVAGKGVSEI